MPCPDQTERLQVIAEAQRIFASGAHYYWGCQAQGVFNQSAVRRMENQWGSTPQQRRLFASQYGGQGPCAGRCNHPDLAGRRRWPDANGMPPADVNQAQYLWPRYFRDPDTVNPGPEGQVYGESCWDKEHYDCAGFVRHCFARVLGRPPGAMRGRTTVVWERGRLPLGQVDIYPGDLAYGSGGNHVGILSGKEDYSAPNPNVSYHAFWSRAGVVRVPLGDCGWIAEVRRWNNWTISGALPT